MTTRGAGTPLQVVGNCQKFLSEWKEDGSSPSPPLLKDLKDSNRSRLPSVPQQIRSQMSQHLLGGVVTLHVTVIAGIEELPKAVGPVEEQALLVIGAKTRTDFWCVAIEKEINNVSMTIEPCNDDKVPIKCEHILMVTLF